MSWGFMRSVLGRRHSDQWAYQAAAEEIRTGQKREGLMLKATAIAEGDQSKADALYAKFLAEEISDENSRETIRSASKTAYRTAAPVAKATSSWFRSASYVSLWGLGIAAVGSFFVMREWARLRGLGFDNYSAAGFFGMALVPAFLIELVVIGTAAFLMLFPVMRSADGRKACLVVAGMLSVFCVIELKQEAKIGAELQQASSSVNMSPASSSSYSTPALVPNQQEAAYNRTLAQLEQQFPQINPESSFFSEDLTNRVAARMQQRVQSGLRREDALRAAVTEVLGQQQLAQQPAAAPAFTIKPSMGAAPPSNIPEHCRQIFIQATDSVPEDTPLAEYARIRDSAENAMQRCMRRQ